MTLVTMTIPSADLLTLATNPVEIVVAPGEGKIIVVRNAWFRFHAGATPYTNVFAGQPFLSWAGAGDLPTNNADMAAAPNGGTAPDGNQPIQGANDQLFVLPGQGLATNQAFPVNNPLWLAAGSNLAGAGPITGVSLNSGASTGPVPYVPGDEASVYPTAFGSTVNITTLDGTPGVNAGDFAFTLVAGLVVTVTGDQSANFTAADFCRIYPSDAGKNGQGQIVSAIFGGVDTVVTLADPNGTLGTVPASGNIVLKATPVTGITLGSPGNEQVVRSGSYAYWINPQAGVGYQPSNLYVNIDSVNYTPPADMGSVTLYVEYEVIAA